MVYTDNYSRYELDIWDGCLVVKIHSSLLPKLATAVEALPDAIQLRREFGKKLKPFSYNSKWWGYGESMEKVELLHDDWVMFKCKAPKPMRDIGESTLISLNATIEMFFALIESDHLNDRPPIHPERPSALYTVPYVPPGRAKLLEFKYWHTIKQTNRKAFGVDINTRLFEWLEKLSSEELVRVMQGVEAEMRSVLRSITFVRKFIAQYTVSARYFPGNGLSIKISVRGRSTCVLKSQPKAQHLEGWVKAHAKDVNKPLQQFLLLAGLAQLHKLARLHGL